ncbi:19580_t:CDS:1, partial [Funneliformis geosporum]
CHLDYLRGLCSMKVALPQLFQSETTLPTMPLDMPNTSATHLRNEDF